MGYDSEIMDKFYQLNSHKYVLQMSDDISSALMINNNNNSNVLFVSLSCCLNLWQERKWHTSKVSQ